MLIEFASVMNDILDGFLYARRSLVRWVGGGAAVYMNLTTTKNLSICRANDHFVVISRSKAEFYLISTTGDGYRLSVKIHRYGFLPLVRKVERDLDQIGVKPRYVDCRDLLKIKIPYQRE